jgi:pimeloyl-ACP methyl ester carboxylesterase
MSTQRAVRKTGGVSARARLISTLPVSERSLSLSGIATSVLEGGAGIPIVLLHGPAACAAHWMYVIPAFVVKHRVIAPDLPDHGATEVLSGELDAERVLDWLDELIAKTCASPPVLVGALVGGAIAARYAARYPDRVSRLVLADAFGLGPLILPPDFSAALGQFLRSPDRDTHAGLWHFCAYDLDGLRGRMGAHWEPFEAYNIASTQSPAQGAAILSLLEHFGAAIDPEELARITVPTTLIWGRHDLANPIPVAERASVRFGWPLYVIEGAADDPAIERPEAFVSALRSAIVSR